MRRPKVPHEVPVRKDMTAPMRKMTRGMDMVLMFSSRSCLMRSAVPRLLNMLPRVQAKMRMMRAGRRDAAPSSMCWGASLRLLFGKQR